MFIYVDRTTNQIVARFGEQPIEGPANTDLIQTNEEVKVGRRWDRGNKRMHDANAEEQSEETAREAERELQRTRPARIKREIRRAFPDQEQAAVIWKIARILLRSDDNPSD